MSKDNPLFSERFGKKPAYTKEEKEKILLRKPYYICCSQSIPLEAERVYDHGLIAFRRCPICGSATSTGHKNKVVNYDAPE